MASGVRSGASIRAHLAFALATLLISFGQRVAAQPYFDPSPAPSASPSEPLASNAPGESEAAETKASDEEDLVQGTLAMDISTASIHELASWCESLKLPGTGGVEELRARLYSHFGVAPPSAATDKRRTITIKSAKRADYFTMEGIEEKYIRLSGGVILTLDDGERGWTHEIRADEILYNETAALLSARGSVAYLLKKPGSEERFYGDRLDVDLDTWSGHFLDGRIVRSGGGESLQTKFVFAADVIKTGADEQAVFGNAIISSTESERPAYSIRASKVWILGSGEWAMSNAVLSVGETPLLYLPFFFYNGEELVFHPVFGKRDREGAFAQTTLYVLGQKPQAKESISLLQLQASTASGPKTVKGWYLVPDPQPKKSDGQNVFKIMLDGYANLGALLGAEAHLAWTEAPKLDLKAILAVTRNVYSTTSANNVATYSPYTAANGWQSVWNSSDFLGYSLPFRYGLEIGSSWTVSFLAMTVSMPLFSDPFVFSDFANRKEDMNWFSFLEEKKNADQAQNPRSALDFSASLSLTPDLSALSPFVTGATINSLKTNFTFQSKDARKVEANGSSSQLYANEDPQRKFFYPERWTLVDTQGNLSGSLFKWPFPEKRPPAAKASGEGAASPSPGPSPSPPPVPIESPLPPRAAWPSPSPKTPWLSEPSAEPENAKASATEKNAPEPEPAFRLEAAPKANPAPQESRNLTTFNLSYTLTPYANAERTFLSAPWNAPEDIDWRVLNDKTLLRLNGNINAETSILGGLATAKAGLTGSTQAQDHPFILSDPKWSPDSSALGLRRTDAQARSDRLGANASLAISPFFSDPVWSPTRLSYSIDAKIYEYALKAGTTDITEFETRVPDWGDAVGLKKFINDHSLSLTLGALPLGWSETLSLTAALPPRDESYTANANLQAGGFKASAQTRLYKSALPADAADPWKFDPLQARASYDLAFPKITVSDAFAYDIEKNAPQSNSISLNAYGLGATYTMKRTKAYQIIQVGAAKQWVEIGEPAFLPSDLTLSYNPAFETGYFWKNRITAKATVNSSVSVDFLKFTNSRLSFILGTNVSISKFLDLSFSSASANDYLYKYVPGLPGIDAPARDPLVDLLKSFNFFQANSEDRKFSLFKLKSIGISAVHYMEDWKLTVSIDGKSVLKTVNNVKTYVFTPTYSISVDWVPIPELKTKTTITEETVTIAPQAHFPLSA